MPYAFTMVLDAAFFPSTSCWKLAPASSREHPSQPLQSCEVAGPSSGTRLAAVRGLTLPVETPAIQTCHCLASYHPHIFRTPPGSHRRASLGLPGRFAELADT